MALSIAQETMGGGYTLFLKSNLGWGVFIIMGRRPCGLLLVTVELESFYYNGRPSCLLPVTIELESFHYKGRFPCLLLFRLGCPRFLFKLG